MKLIIFILLILISKISFAINCSGQGSCSSGQTECTFSTASNGDDLSVNSTDDAVYASVVFSSCTTGVSTSVARNLSGTYQIRYAVYKWDTSEITTGFSIVSASFSPYINTILTNTDSRNIQGDWFDWSAGCSSATWIHDAPTANAFSTSLGGLTTSARNSITLSNLTNISKTGTTYLRVGVDGGQPTGNNRSGIQQFDSGTPSQYPQLIACIISNTPTPTNTPANTPTTTPTEDMTNCGVGGCGRFWRTPTSTPTPTNTSTRTPTGTKTPTPTFGGCDPCFNGTPTFSPTVTITPTPSPTLTPSPTPSFTPTVTPTYTPVICSGSQLMNGLTWLSGISCVTQIPTATLIPTATPVSITPGYDETGGGQLTTSRTLGSAWASQAYSHANLGGL